MSEPTDAQIQAALSTYLDVPRDFGDWEKWQIESMRAALRVVVAGESEWEYINLIGEAPMQMAIKATPENATHKRTARRVIEPGPWMPVNQEGGS